MSVETYEVFSPSHGGHEYSEDENEPREQSIRQAVPAELGIDSLQNYLQEIGRIPLLSAAQEVELAERIARGKAARQRLAGPEQLTPQLHVALHTEIAGEEDARQQLIQANLRLVVSIAKKYAGRGLALQDLIQEGNLGLMRAVEKFNAGLGNRFSTYATWWVRQAVTRAIAEKGRTIRLPVHLSDDIGQIKRASERLAQSLERQPTVAELAQTLGQPHSRISRVIESSYTPLSLETPVGDEQDHTLGDFLEDTLHSAPADLAAQRLMNADLAMALNQLSERERRILGLRYGVADGRHRTLEEVGKELGMTRERARQIEATALRRLRDSEFGRHLRDYLE